MDFLAFEEGSGLRKRQRKEADQQVFEETLSMVVCDVSVDALLGGGGVHISRARKEKKTRYREPGQSSKQLPTILDGLADLGYLVQQVPDTTPRANRKRRTTIEAGPTLIQKLRDAGITEDEFSREWRGEPIVLKSPSDPDDFWDRAELQEYSDDLLTTKYRNEMEKINVGLESADIQWLPNARTMQTPDLPQRSMKRVFSRGRWDSGGRLYGGFWMTMPKQHRFDGIRINGEQIVEVDYGQVMLRLIYALRGKTPPAGDLYAIPGFEVSREGIKRIVNAMFFRSTPFTQFPKETPRLFPRETTIHQVSSAILARHHAIAECFFSEVGHKGQYMESNLLITVLQRLRSQHITALPIHDAVLVPASTEAKTVATMEEVFRDMTGMDGSVTVTRG
ncbi:hypothetical protein [uncultured Litoreibacter sp.]|uniref:hypothetical protein n=1 Tax=uncultured Litoreibacter sp. TaxID=1392394 RepID=UPI0026115607|nr:hypothetical protein [uncultured Litoreibacter sp.]